MVIEVKRANTETEIQSLLDKGYDQIDKHKYGADFIRKNYELIRYTICFYKKSVRVKLFVD